MSMGLDKIIILALVIVALGALIYLQRSADKNQEQPPDSRIRK